MRLLIAAALVAGLLGTAASAQATLGLPEVLRPAAANLFPEGVAWDPSRRALLVGSFTNPARISAVGRDGVARTVVTDDVPGFIGLRVDAKRRRIVAAYGHPADPTRTGVAFYDLATGARTRLVPLTGLTNDIALAGDGTVYATDSAGGAVYRIDPAGTVTTVVRDPRLAGAPFGANGIVRHPSGYLLTVNYTTGKLYRFAAGQLTEVRTPALVGGDGMALRGNTLLVVTNALGGAGANALHELWLTRGGTAAVPLRDHQWPDPAPTTVAVTPFGDYVLDGRLDAFLAGGTASDFVLRRSP